MERDWTSVTDQRNGSNEDPFHRASCDGNDEPEPAAHDVPRDGCTDTTRTRARRDRPALAWASIREARPVDCPAGPRLLLDHWGSLGLGLDAGEGAPHPVPLRDRRLRVREPSRARVRQPRHDPWIYPVEFRLLRSRRAS